MQEFKNSDQMKSFMKKESKRLNISPANVYSTFTARSFLEKLSIHTNDQVLVKGSSAEIAYLGRRVRAITDIDLAHLNNFQINDGWFQELLEEQERQITFSLRKEPKKTPTGIYKMTLEASFDKMRQPLGIDIQENYSRLIEKEVRVMPAIFEGDKEFEILVPSYEEYLAEKLCIILESNKTDVLNTRVKDFYDIYQLHGGKYDYDKLTDYFGKTLALRGKINIEDAKTLYLNQHFIKAHEKVWDSTKEKYGFLDQEIDLAGAVYYTRAVLREQLQKHGQEMSDNITPQYQKKAK